MVIIAAAPLSPPLFFLLLAEILGSLGAVTLRLVLFSL